MNTHVTVILNFIFFNFLRIILRNETQKILIVYYKSCTTNLTRHDLMQIYKHIKLRFPTGLRLLNEDITKCLDTYCNTSLYVSTTVFITQGNM